VTTNRLTRESLAWLVVIGMVAVIDAWWVRAMLNPDGAAYLDLADAMRRGEWSAVVQGYWSPLYPLLAAVVRSAASAVGMDQLAAVHALNAGLVIAGGVLVHRLVRSLVERHGTRSTVPAALWLRCTWAAYAICALVYARIDGVTPDLLLLVVMVAVLDELLRRGAQRPLRLGLLLGAAFLAKTSSWPWLVVMWGWLATPWGARAPGAAVARGAMATVAILLAWLVPLGIAAGRPTLGSTGRLNACWFLRDCDGQSPDTHRGAHARYATLAVSTGDTITYARYAGGAATYEPWSDPTAWAAGVRTQRQSPLAVGAMAAVVVDNLADAIRYLGLYLWLAALVPALLWWAMSRPSLAWGDEPRLALGASVMGAVGIAQFVAVQVQPRLMAPFAWLHVAGALAWLFAASVPSSGGAAAHRTRAALGKGGGPAGKKRDAGAVAGREVPRGMSTVLGWVPVLAAIVAIALVLWGDRTNAASDATYRAELREASTRASGGRTPREVVVVGEAFPLVSHAKSLDIVFVAQVLPASVPTLDALDPRERQRLLQQAGHGTADVAWQRQADGRVRVTALR
jgi:hypothetical protein